MRRQLTLALIVVGGAALLLVGLGLLGRAARDRLRQEGRFTVAFDDIDCPPPPGYERLAFLHEVQYLARLPDRLPILDEDLPPRLAEAFARHPWVEKVEEVRAAPPDRVRVRPRFRTPVLVVRTPAGTRVVDGSAILLPPSTPDAGLPILEMPSGPRGITGRAWGHASVVTAAAVAALLRPHQERLQLTIFEMEKTGLVLRGSQVRVLWGAAPGKEARDETAAAEKLARLVEHCDRHGRLDLPEGATHDVRTR